MQQESLCVLGFFNVCVVFYGKTVLSNIFRWAADLRLLELFTASGETFLNFCHLMGCLSPVVARAGLGLTVSGGFVPMACRR